MQCCEIDRYWKWLCSANLCAFHRTHISMIGLDRSQGWSYQTFQLLAWHLVLWCAVPWSTSLFKMAMLGQFLCVSRNFEISMIVLDQVWGTTLPLLFFQGFSYRPDIWWDDAQYNEAYRYLIWICSANLCTSTVLRNFPWEAWTRKMTQEMWGNIVSA